MLEAISKGEQVFFSIVLLQNILVFCLYYVDKQKAKKRVRRISEKTLLWASFIMGGWGALFGMQVFRHKTKHLSFKLLIPISAVFTTIICYLVLSWNQGKIF